MEQLFRIEEETTTGWNVVEPEYVGMTREKTREVLESLIADGYNPNLLRVVLEK